MEMSEKENNEQIPKFAQVSTDVAFQESKKKKKSFWNLQRTSQNITMGTLKPKAHAHPCRNS